MSGDQIVQIVTVVVALLGGVFGRSLLDWWRDRGKQQAEVAVATNQRVFADNEQARIWLRAQLDESEQELKAVREREHALMLQVAELATLGARNEERLNAQAVLIDEMRTQMTKLGVDYAEIKRERDDYRNGKHDADNKLTAESLRAQLALKDIALKDAEIERLRGQVAALTPPRQEDR
jgi:chromosome segregation ATPase